MGVAEEPEVEPRVKDFDHKATDAEEGLIPTAGKFAEAKVLVLERNPLLVEETKEEGVWAES